MPDQFGTVKSNAAVECCAPMIDEALTEPAAISLAKVFKALGDPVRLRLLSLIAARTRNDSDHQVCVCELTGAFDVKGPTISHHLRVLREAGLVDHERRGTWVYYRAVPDALAPLAQLLDPSSAQPGRQPFTAPPTMPRTK